VLARARDPDGDVSRRERKSARVRLERTEQPVSGRFHEPAQAVSEAIPVAFRRCSFHSAALTRAVRHLSRERLVRARGHVDARAPDPIRLQRPSAGAGGRPSMRSHMALVRLVMCALYARATLGVIVPASVSLTISDFARLAACSL
jgi:hypothetical protein